jgi:hypothetical protein
MGIGIANVSTRCLAQTCQEIVSGGDRKLKFLKEEAGRGGARDEGTDIRGIVGGTEVRHRTAEPVVICGITLISQHFVFSPQYYFPGVSQGGGWHGYP